MAEITVQNLVSSRTREGIVEILFDGKSLGQMDVVTARKLAQDVHECAAVAECDAMLIGFLTDRGGLSVEQAGEVLRDFRARRGE
jgi:hypothetical protein